MEVRRRSARLLEKQSLILGTGTVVSPDVDMDASYHSDSDGPIMEATEGEPEFPEPDSALEPGEGYDWTKNGFDRGFEPKKIHNVYVEEETDGFVTKFTVEFYETREWEDILSDVVKLKCPDLVIAFYESRVKFESPLRLPPQQNQDADEMENSSDSDSSDGEQTTAESESD